MEQPAWFLRPRRGQIWGQVHAQSLFVNQIASVLRFRGNRKSNQLKLKLTPKGNGMAASIPGQVAGAKPRKKRGEKKEKKKILKLKLQIDQRHSPKTHDNTGALSRFFIRWWSMAGRGQILLK